MYHWLVLQAKFHSCDLFLYPYCCEIFRSSLSKWVLSLFKTTRSISLLKNCRFETGRKFLNWLVSKLIFLNKDDTKACFKPAILPVFKLRLTSFDHKGIKIVKWFFKIKSGQGSGKLHLTPFSQTIALISSGVVGSNSYILTKLSHSETAEESSTVQKCIGVNVGVLWVSFTNNLWIFSILVMKNSANLLASSLSFSKPSRYFLIGSTPDNNFTVLNKLFWCLDEFSILPRM